MTTRNSKRVRTFAMLVKNVDQDQRQSKLQSYLDMLESDYYESPNKLAEEELSDQSINKKKLKITRKVKPIRTANLRRNVNLKKMLKQQPFTEFPNFINIAPTCQYKKPDHCSICKQKAKYTCPRCQERYCSIECNQAHKEIQCLRLEY